MLQVSPSAHRRPGYLADPGLYCDRPLWEQAPGPQEDPKSGNDTILELFGSGTPEQVPAETTAPPRNPQALPKRAAPRLKGLARRDHALSQSGLSARLAEKKLRAAAIGSAREQLSSNYMIRSTVRTAQTAAEVGESTTCPECGRQFCSIWVFRILIMGGRL